MHAIGALARCPGNGRASVSGRGPLSEKRETTLVVSLFSGRAPWVPDAHSASPRTRPGPKRKRFPPCQGWRNGWGGRCEQGGTGGSGSYAEIAPCPPAKPPGTMGSREGSPLPTPLPRGRMRVAGKAGRGRGAGVSRRGAGPLLDNPPQPKRGDSPDGESFGYAAPAKPSPAKNGGEREVRREWGRDGGRRNGRGEAGRFAWRRIFWIRGAASRRQRKGRGVGGWAGIERRGDSPGGESLDTRRRQSRRQRRSAGSEGIAKRRNENGQEERGRWEANPLASRGNASG